MMPQPITFSKIAMFLISSCRSSINIICGDTHILKYIYIHPFRRYSYFSIQQLHQTKQDLLLQFHVIVLVIILLQIILN